MKRTVFGQAGEDAMDGGQAPQPNDISAYRAVSQPQVLAIMKDQALAPEGRAPPATGDQPPAFITQYPILLFRIGLAIRIRATTP